MSQASRRAWLYVVCLLGYEQPAVRGELHVRGVRQAAYDLRVGEALREVCGALGGTPIGKVNKVPTQASNVSPITANGRRALLISISPSFSGAEIER
jgi:hypothetical protein